MTNPKALAAKLWNALKTFVHGCTGERLATLSMRGARPVFFILLTVMLLVGWWQPAHLGTYFSALAKAPDWLADIITIFVLGLAVEKGIARPLENVAKALKGKAD